ncbi:MAG: hypothetical protein WC315_00695 [Candidatus Omnitrophota bacterium]|jgi:hypothetical protein
MTGLLINIGILFMGVWCWQFIKVIDSPADPKAEADFWKVCFFTEYWHGPDDKI